MIDVGDRVDRFSDALVKGVKISSSLLRTLWALPDAMKWLMVCFNQSPITSFCGRVLRARSAGAFARSGSG